MISPKHELSALYSSRPFVGRDVERGGFLNKLRGIQSKSDYDISVWLGVGGQGKSAFAREIEKASFDHFDDPRNDETLGLAYLDFDRLKNRAPDQALLSARLQFRNSGKISFPCFDTAYMRLICLESPGIDVRSAHPELFLSENDIINDIWNLGSDIADAIPGASLLYKYASRGGGRLKDWWERKGKIHLTGLDDLDANGLIARLPFLFGADIATYLEESPESRLVLILDTYEALFRERSLAPNGMPGLVDQWVRALVQELTGVKTVIFSREVLSWQKLDNDWSEVLNYEQLEPLKDSECREFLSKSNLNNGLIQDRIVEGAEGLPFYLHLQLDQYHLLMANGSDPLPENFGGTHAEILTRFVDHLPDIEFHQLSLLSYPMQIDPEVTQALNDAEIGLDVNVAEQVQKRSVFKPIGDNHFTMHQLLRNSLQAREQEDHPERFLKSHKCLFEFYSYLANEKETKSVRSFHAIAFDQAAYHLSAYQPKQTAEWILENEPPFFDAGRWSDLRSIYLRGLECATDHDQEVLGFRLSERLATCLFKLGSFAEAKQGFLTLFESADAFDEIPDVLRAQWFNNFGSLLYAIEELDECEIYFSKALKIAEGTSEEYLPFVAELRSNLANLHHTRGNYQIAEDLYVSAVNLSRQTQGSESGELASRLHGLGRLYQDRGRYVEAEKTLLDALDITKKFYGSRHVHVAGRLDDLGRLYRDQGRLAEAMDCCLEAVEIGDRRLGSDHPNLAMWLDNLSLVYRDKRDFNQAEFHCRRAIEISKSALGNEHSHLAIWKNNLSLILRETGQLEEAMAEIEDVIKVYETVHGPEHIWCAVALTNKANILVDLGEVDEATGIYDTAVDLYKLNKLELHPNYARTIHLKTRALIGVESEKSTLKALHNVKKLYADSSSLPDDSPWRVELEGDLEKVLDLSER